ncbi:MAG: glycosyltransferase family 4 protein [Planctomyces sp.]|nr:glycosyltransferase family 4 protein [Planctomyces sp.]
MRVAHVITRLILGGAQENTLHTVDDQHHLHGDEVCLITGPGLGPEGSLEGKAKQRSLDVRLIPEMRRSLHPIRDWKAYRHLVKILREYQPDIVHTHSSKAGILGRRAAWKLGIPAVHTIHGAAFHYGQRAIAYYAYLAAEKLAARWCQHFISVCDAMTQQYVDAGIAPREKFTTIYSGMDVDAYLSPSVPADEMRQRLGLHPDDIVVGKVARLFHLKGHEYLIESAPEVVRRNPNVRFLLVGDGILRQQFQQRIDQLGLTPHFVFAGLVAPEEVRNYLHAMDIVVHSSAWEGLARVLPQGLLAGKPVISFAIDGAPEVCIDGETGLLVPPRSVEGLSQAIIQLAESPQLRTQYGDAGRRECVERFRHQFMTERIRSVYENVLQGGTR